MQCDKGGLDGRYEAFSSDTPYICSYFHLTSPGLSIVCFIGLLVQGRGLLLLLLVWLRNIDVLIRKYRRTLQALIL